MCQKRRQDIKGQNQNESSGSNLQVAAAGEDEEDLGVVDWQQCTAGWEAAHGDIEESAFWGSSWSYAAARWAAGAETRSVISCAILANSECAPRRGLTAVFRDFGSRVGALPLAEGGTLQSALLYGHGWLTSPPICDILRSMSERSNRHGQKAGPLLLIIIIAAWSVGKTLFTFCKTQKVKAQSLSVLFCPTVINFSKWCMQLLSSL